MSDRPPPLPSYALVTPAHNEERVIEATIASVAAQTHRPVKWVLVDDGSTDRTGTILRTAAAKYPWIEALTAPPGERTGFGSKIRAFRAGYERLRPIPYAFVGNLDADVTFEPDYFARLLARMAADPTLGLAGGIILEPRGSGWSPQPISLDSVAGAVQMFRRDAFEAIGGFIELDLGGEDSAAEIMVRMHGWRTQTFPDLGVRHHGRVTMGGRSVLATRFNKGRVNYELGYHPLFHLALSLYRMRHRPYIAGGLLILAGYVYDAVRRAPRPMPPDVVRYVRREQRARLAAMLGLRRGRTGSAPAPIQPSSGAND